MMERSKVYYIYLQSMCVLSKSNSNTISPNQNLTSAFQVIASLNSKSISFALINFKENVYAKLNFLPFYLCKSNHSYQFFSICINNVKSRRISWQENS